MFLIETTILECGRTAHIYEGQHGERLAIASGPCPEHCKCDSYQCWLSHCDKVYKLK